MKGQIKTFIQIPLNRIGLQVRRVEQGIRYIAGYLQERGFMLHNLYGLISNHKGQLAWGDAIFIQKK